MPKKPSASGSPPEGAAQKSAGRPGDGSRPRAERREAPAASSWPPASSRTVWLVALGGVVAATLGIYGQTLAVPALDYEDSFYLVRNPYVNVPAPWARLGAVWAEPYFANYHPVTTTTWLLDQSFAARSSGFDARPFRAMHLVYAVAGALLIVPLFRGFGIPGVLSAAAAILFAVHPIHTEVVAWLSARKDLTALTLTLAAMIAYVTARRARSAAEWRLRHAVTAGLALVAVLSKPTAVIVPALFVAFELCAGGAATARGGAASPVARRALALAVLQAAAGGLFFVAFRAFLAHRPAAGAGLAAVPVLLTLLLWLVPVRPPDLAAFREGSRPALGVIGPAHVVYAAIAAAGSAWTLWAQSAVGAIKGGLALVPTLNLTGEAMLAYAGKVVVPAFMSTVYVWNAYPAASLRGVAGAILAAGLAAAALRLALGRERALRMAGFGILWYLIAFVPVSNLVPTSTKMADRYLFLPSVGAILTLVALLDHFVRGRRRQTLALVCLATAAAGYGVWAHGRTEVWCGKTTPRRGAPHPDLSLWTAAVATHPTNHSAMTSLAGVYLGMDPPEAERALEHLTRALRLAEAEQERIAGGKRLDLSPLHQALGSAYLELARGNLRGRMGEERAALEHAVDYFEAAARFPLGFAPADARLYWRLAEAREQLAGIVEAATDGAAAPAALGRREALRAAAMAALAEARRVLDGGGVAARDIDLRGVLLAAGTFLFGRAAAAPPPEQAAGYRSALARYDEARRLLPDDPRPVFYQGLCWERIFGLERGTSAGAVAFTRAEEAYRTALTLRVQAPEYHPLLPYRALASLYNTSGRRRDALDLLLRVRGADPAYSRDSGVERDIQALESSLRTTPQP